MVFSCGPRKKAYNEGREPGSPVRGDRRNTGENAMKDAIAAAALVIFAVIMLFFPSAWEPVTDAEARRLLDD